METKERTKAAAVAMSIRPEWSRKIFDGSKRVEYRSGFPEGFSGTVFVYESGPQGSHKVTGKFRTERTARCHPDMFTDEAAMLNLADVADFAGMPDEEFLELLEMRPEERPVTLLPVLEAERFGRPLTLDEFNRTYRPDRPLRRTPITWQSFHINEAGQV